MFRCFHIRKSTYIYFIIEALTSQLPEICGYYAINEKMQEPLAFCVKTSGSCIRFEKGREIFPIG